MWRAAERLGIKPAAADPARADRLLTIRERVLFRHPLLRAVVYQSAPATDLRATHLALAEVTRRTPIPPSCLASRRSGSRPGLEGRSGTGEFRWPGTGPWWPSGGRLVPEALGDADSRSCPAGARALSAEPVFRREPASPWWGCLLRPIGPLDALQRAPVNVLRPEPAFAEPWSRSGAAAARRKCWSRSTPGSRARLNLEAWDAASFAGAMVRGTSLGEISRKALATRRYDNPSGPVDLLLEGFSLPFYPRTRRGGAATPASTGQLQRQQGPPSMRHFTEVSKPARRPHGVGSRGRRRRHEPPGPNRSRSESPRCSATALAGTKRRW